MIQKLVKAHYLCLNIEVSNDTLTEIETGFRFNDAVLRHLTVSRDKAETAPSIMMKGRGARRSPQGTPGGDGLIGPAASAAGVEPMKTWR